MMRPGAAGFDPAALVALASVFGIAVAVCMVKRLPEGESHATMLAYFCLMSLALTVVPAAVRWTPPSASQWLLLAGVGSLVVVSPARSEERRGGKECGNTCRSRWSASN